MTLLFADIAGFTEFSNKASAYEVVSLLRELFIEFDKISMNYEVFKLYTIGDCYVVMSFLDAELRNYAEEAKNVTLLAFEMINHINDVKKKYENKNINFDMRIGIHTVKY